MKEEWKPVVGWESLYSVSSFGRVRREVYRNRYFPGRTLKGEDDRGRVRLVLRDASKGKCAKYAHQLVMEAFVGPRPAGMEINHIDGDPSNNRVENLEYVTRKQNMDHAVRMGLRARGTNVHTAKLDDNDVRRIRNSSANNHQLAREFGVSPACVWSVKNGKSWRWVS